MQTNINLKSFRDLLGDNAPKMLTHFRSTIQRLEQSYLKHSTLPHFTSHGADHSLSIEKIIESLVPTAHKSSFNAMEIYILFMGIYFHDIGMAVKQPGDEQKENESKAEFEKRLDNIRRTHSMRAYQFIMQKYRSFAIDRGAAQAIADICLAHSDHKPFDAPRMNTFQELRKKNAIRTVEKFDVRIQLLAALLRLADELDLDYERADADLEEMRDMPAISRKEWMKHQLISGVKIDSDQFCFWIDIFEGDLIGDDQVNTEMAQRNEGIADVVIKLRKALAEVGPVLWENGLNYREVLFRDPIVTDLQRILDEQEIPPVKEAQTYIFTDEQNAGSRITHFRHQVESLQLSPDFFICRNLDFLLDPQLRFIRELPLIMKNNMASPNPGTLNKDIDALREQIMRYLNAYDFLYPIEDEDLGDDKNLEEEYRIVIEELVNSISENTFDSKRFLGDFSRHSRKIISRMYKKGCFQDVSISGLQGDVIKTVMEDILRLLRSRAICLKSNAHFIHVVFNIDYMIPSINRLRVMVNEERAAFATRWVEITHEMNRIIDEHPNIQFYYHDDPIATDLYILSSELALLSGPSPETLIVIRDVSQVVSFYEAAVNLVSSPKTWKISGIDPQKNSLLLQESDSYHETHLNRLGFMELTQKRLEHLTSQYIHFNKHKDTTDTGVKDA